MCSINAMHVCLIHLYQVFKALKDMEEVAVYYSYVLRFILYTLIIMLVIYLLACLQQGVMCYV